MIISMEDFGKLFETFKKSACRIETLDQYLVEGEMERFEEYKNGALLPRDGNDDWASMIKGIVDSGRYIGRVHIISRDVSPYVRFEAEWYYTFNASAGDEIRFVYRDEMPPVTFSDTWIFDEETVIDMAYNKDGKYLYANHNDDPRRLEQALESWKNVYDLSFDLTTFFQRLRSASVKL